MDTLQLVEQQRDQARQDLRWYGRCLQHCPAATTHDAADCTCGFIAKAYEYAHAELHNKLENPNQAE